MGRESYNPQYNMIIASVKLDMLDAVNAQKKTFLKFNLRDCESFF